MEMAIQPLDSEYGGLMPPFLLRTEREQNCSMTASSQHSLSIIKAGTFNFWAVNDALYQYLSAKLVLTS